MDQENTPTAKVQRALATLELASVRYRGGVRRRLNVGDEELTALLYLAHHGGVPQRRLAEITTLSRSGAGAMIQRLEQDGFVERRTHPSDRRLRLVELAPTGVDRINAAYHDLTEATDRFLTDSPAAELDLLARLLDGLAGAARATHGEDDANPLSPPSAGDPIWRRWA
jgi:DNA-binding MarR family transcriptional regulator